MRRSLKKLLQNGQKRSQNRENKDKAIYINIGKMFSYPNKVFLSENLYFELPKNVVICFTWTLASFFSSYCKIFPQLSTSFKFKAWNFTVATETAHLWKPSESTQDYLEAPKAIHNYPKRSTQKYLQSP